MNKKLFCLFTAAFTASLSLHAQDVVDPYDLPEFDEAPEEQPWILTAGLEAGIFTYVHSALQRRSDDAFDSSEDFRDNEADGEGWGVAFEATKGDGTLVVDFLRTDSKYENIFVRGSRPAGSRINTDRTDLEVLWRQKTGENPNGHWGWHAGVKWVGENLELLIVEGGERVNAFEDINWLMLKAGYYGELTPWEGQILTAHGQANLLLGEVEGFARTAGSDVDPTDGNIEEDYGSEFSLAYGASAIGGITLHILDQFHVTAEYRREWLYSFEATGSGVTVFPDNNDAKFINISHGVFIYANYVW